MYKLTGNDIFKAHLDLADGMYCSEAHIRETEARILNKIIFEKGNEARRVARNQAAKPPATRKIADKRRKPAKHRKPLQEE